jgi:hypothetical protein
MRPDHECDRPIPPAVRRLAGEGVLLSPCRLYDQAPGVSTRMRAAAKAARRRVLENDKDENHPADRRKSSFRATRDPANRFVVAAGSAQSVDRDHVSADG